MITIVGLLLLVVPAILIGYAVLVYPAILWIMARLRTGKSAKDDSGDLPFITLTVPAYNEEASIRETLDALLGLDYPENRRQILVISDASTDRTDEIVREFRDSGVELLRMPVRGGKTAAENAAGAHARGDLVVNIDATVRVLPGSLKPLVRAFSDPTVGVASGRDVSVSTLQSDKSAGEAGYVGYEMWVRDLETQAHSIVGASGCFYATRRELYHESFPNELSRDFASALIARENGFRSVSVADAICLVPRSKSLRGELRRKTRTMARGLATLEHMRHLMLPERSGLFAWMLISHKLCRWLFYVALPFSVLGLVLLSIEHVVARYALAAVIAGIGVGALGLLWPEEKELPRLAALPAFALATNLAGVLAWWRYLSGERDAVWEPTRRSG